MLRGRLLLATAYIVFLVIQTSESSDTNHCASTCGKINNISYPFRLDGDPQNCGSHDYTLYCENNTSAVLYLFSGKYYVQAINYNNFTIRLVDAGVQKDNCSSLPLFSLAYDNFSIGDERFIRRKDPYTWYKYRWTNGSEPLPPLSKTLTIMNCVNPVLNSPLYLDTAPCITNGLEVHSYVNVERMTLADLMEHCTIERIMLLPEKDYTSLSFKEIHNELAYGFELSWYNIYCGKCEFGCFLDHKNKSFCLFSRGGFPLYPVMTGFLYYFSILSAIVHGTKVAFGTPCVIALLIYKWRRRHLSAYDRVEEYLQNQNNLMPVRYPYSDIKKMTGGFKDKLGEGGFGSVYKGKLRSGRLAAIKMLGKSKANGQDFINEVATIGRIHHVNVVQLIGFCAEGSKRALVYEFMPNGSLNNFIFSQDGSASLSWEKLSDISLGVARGIGYLHEGCEMQILHFDIKPHNILLDENLNPKVSDFGLARLYPTNGSAASLTAARGTIGYMAPELFYKNIGRVSYKADVYSFGMLLLEMAGKRKNLNALAEKSSEIYWPYWIHDQISNGNAMDIGDNATEYESKIVRKMIIVGLWCIQMKPVDRPAMNKVVETLEGDLESLQLPPKPILYLDEPPINIGEESSFLSDDSTESISLIENAC